jgi:NAD(P)-dependent dehydrogenase (short-subunit alcohol dehydrogenase family)
MSHLIPRPVLAIVGIGGMGAATARRLGSGRHVFLADYNQQSLDKLAEEMRLAGHITTSHQVDVSDAASVRALASAVKAAGRLEILVHTAGVSPQQAPLEQILKVDLLGTAHVLDAFEHVVQEGTSVVCISSIAADMYPHFGAEEGLAQGTAASDTLLDRSAVKAITDPAAGYGFSKLANRYRVIHKSIPYGMKGARLNAISPGVMSTPMGRAEFDKGTGQTTAMLNDWISKSRWGTPDDIAAATEFLSSAGASFINGINLQVDGGVRARIRAGDIKS